MPIVPLDYMKLLSHCDSDSLHPNQPFINFLELCLIINNARPAALVSLQTENLDLIESVVNRVGVDIDIIKWTVNYNLVFNTKHVTRNLVDKMKVYNHVSLGKTLGYLTPFDLDSSNKSGSRIAAEIRVDIMYKGHIIKNIQLAPQVIINKTEAEIDAYYKPMVDVLQALKSKFASEDVHFKIDKIVLNKTPITSNSKGGRRSTRKNHNKRKTTRRST